MVDCGSCRMDRSSLTVSSFRSRASKSLLLVGSARAVICPKRAVGVKRSIRSSGLKVIINTVVSQAPCYGWLGSIFPHDFEAATYRFGLSGHRVRAPSATQPSFSGLQQRWLLHRYFVRNHYAGALCFRVRMG